MRGRWPRIVGGTILLVLALLFVAAFLIDEPLRRVMEREVNRRLVGYQVTIARLDFHPIGFSLDLEDVVVVQEGHPDPPVADVKAITASVEWRQILRGRVVADFRFLRPSIHVNKQHLQREVEDDVPITKRGWQEALQAIYPLKINTLRVVDGDFTYLDTEMARITKRPLKLDRVNVEARNIRNIRSAERVYPSDVRLDAVVFDAGRVAFRGRADFLAEPHVGVKGDVSIENVPLDGFEPLLARYDLAIRSGVLAGAGSLEIAPQVNEVHFREVTVQRFDGEYTHTGRARQKKTEREVAQKAGEVAERASNHPNLLLKVDTLRVRDGRFAFANRAARQPYRVLLTDTNIEVKNFSNQRAEGLSTVTLTGRFMGTGPTVVKATFRPETNGPDFDLSVRIEDTDMRTMNDLFRAYGRFDVVRGVFSLYTELSVKNRTINGYVKPLFRDLNVYDERQDAEKSAFRKLYERIVEGVSKLLENYPRDEVATKADVSGPIEDPKARTWVVVVRLVQNAFFKAILPGFEGEVVAASRGRRPVADDRKSARGDRS